MTYEKEIWRNGLLSWSGHVLMHSGPALSQFPRPLMVLTDEAGFGSFTRRGVDRKLTRAIRRREAQA